uniref:Mitochondrial outer membrane protein porin of 36 kDa-like n=1 Tax=Rhizophora mucronata TaxID=61149 RepID=A0A2P2L0D9_RHIMU
MYLLRKMYTVCRGGCKIKRNKLTGMVSLTPDKNYFLQHNPPKTREIQ